MRVTRAVVGAALIAAGLPLVVGSPAHAASSAKILITGDSISQGSSGDYTWRYRLWKKLSSTAPGKATFVGTRDDLYDNVNDKQGSHYYAASFSGNRHSAKWGDAYAHELGDIASQVKSSKATVLVSMLGSNDLAFLATPAETIANVRTYIQRARKAKPGLDIVVGDVLSRYDAYEKTYTITQEAAEYNRLLADLAADLNTSAERVVVAHTEDGWDAKDDTYDGTHPNPTGETIIAQNVSEALAKLGIGSASPNIAQQTAWGVKGPKVGVKPGSESAALSWSRTSTGSLGMFIELRLTNIDQAWDRLPYAVSGNGWTAELLAAGGTYQFRIVPSKVWNTGKPGPVTQAVVGGPKPAALTKVSTSADQKSIYGGRQVKVSWPASKKATGYLLSSATYGSGKNHWDDLPYAVDADTRSWTWEPLPPGRYMKFRVKPVRGYLSPGWKNGAMRRLSGIPGDRVYVALGDSYSSGLGSAPISDGYSGSTCYRTKRAWAYKVHDPSEVPLKHLACAGATTVTVTSKQIGKIAAALAKYPHRPELVTMTVGGNDIGFSDLAKKCMLGSSCTKYEASENKKIDAVRAKLVTQYKAIKAKAPYADIVVGGYPVVAEPGAAGGLPDTCDPFGNNERAMAKRLVTRLNSKIASAATAAGVWSAAAAIQSEFDGHGACSSDEWINGPLLKGATVNPNSFHPKESGQNAYAWAINGTIAARSGTTS